MSARSTYSYGINIDAKTVIGNTNTAHIEYRAEVPLSLWENPQTPEKRWVMALSHLTVYNSQPNVSAEFKNNYLEYKWGANPVRQIILPDGTYTVAQLSAAIQNVMFTNADYTPPAVSTDPIEYDIILTTNVPLNKIDIQLGKTGVVTVLDMSIGSFKYLLGYTAPDILLSSVSEYWQSDISPDMTAGISTFNVEVSVIGGTYRNERITPTLYSFSPNAPPGSLMDIRPNFLIYRPINLSHSLSDMTIRLTSNTGKLLNLRDENVTMSLEILYTEA